IPKINRSELKSLALAGAGVYSDITVNNTDIERLHKMDINKELNKDNPFVREVDLWRDQGHLFLLLALPFAALGFRRGWLGTVLVLSIMVPPQDAYALSWEDLWVNKNQQAQKELNEGNAKDASELFENPQWKGVAQYKNGDFEKAGEQFLKSDTAESYYNLGNSLARQGKFKEAIDAYNNTLERDPKHKDAEFNKTLVQKLIDEQESDQEQKSDENKDSDKDSDEKSDQKDKNKSESDQKESDQSQDSQDADQKEAQDKESQDKEKQKKEEQKKEEQQQNKTDEQKEAEKSEEQKAQEQKEIEDNKTPEQKEIEQATEQWLRRIPDDPGGLLREKMRRQNIRDRQRQRPTTENQW
ncbi:MAG: tetratricopeptide repeat protein, partial [Gammaproteobacteria bacterium]|nr:tetratricopeptide repeat protein [Gammaproteobacteria bacterium]